MSHGKIASNGKIRNDQKSHVSFVIKIDQSQMSHGKIASNGKMSLIAK